MKACALLLFLAAPAAAGGPHYLTLVKAGNCGAAAPADCRAESYKALEKMVQLAGAQGAKLTLLFSDSYAQFVSSDAARVQAAQGWKAAGHELGAWHRAEDPALAGGEPLPALAGLAGSVKTGCTGLADPAQRAPYEVCSGGAQGGANKYLVPAAGGKKALHSYEPAGRAGVAAAKKQFSAMKGGVYSAAFAASPDSFGAFYAWLSFLKEQDRFGERSRTAALTVEAKLLTEKAAAPASRGPAKTERAGEPLTGLVSAPEGTQDPERRPEAEPGRTPIPKMVPKPSPFSMVERLFFGRKGGWRDSRPLWAPSRRAEPGYLPPYGRGPAGPPARPAVCGDGICQTWERAGAVRCPRDCK